ncbi:MAG: sigma-70 family RNA polymerase sigma factor [Candidatus Poribacteria bacterium]|nr:sigma-70 family RNA polymerase sigma factor [Candidatus Poribacteria bacterium]
MKNNDIELVRRILEGDEAAFSTLVEKYQKQVHALAWRKIGDFHIAEEITQDTFLKAYQKLATLKKPHRLAGWLYVIATRCCQAWLRKKRIQIESLEEIDSEEIEPEAYSRYVVEEEAKVTVEAQRQIVKNLLATLPESERTVITLHYFGDMTCERMSEFLGVSANTIKSRLRRARNRLKKEEPMIREAISNFQISPNLTDNIMREVNRLKPAAPSVSKPLVPWAVAASSAVLIMLMLGIGSQYLTHFQNPYSLDAHAERMVELVDAPIFFNLEVKPNIRNQLANANALNKTDNNGQKPDAVLLAAAQSEGEDIAAAKQQWIQSEPIRGSEVISLLATPEGEVYALADRNIYKLETDGKGWRHIFDTNLLDTDYEGEAVMKKWGNTLYLILSTDLFASKDDGKTWDLVHSWPRDRWYPLELVVTRQAFYMLFYIGNDVLRSEDKGKTWKAINGQIDRFIASIVNIQDTLFARTRYALYRFTDDNWQRLEFPVSVGKVRSVAATEEKLYVVAEASDDVLDSGKVSQGQERGWWIFRSTDLGESWDDITPTNAWPVKGLPPRLQLIAVGDTLLAMEHGMVSSPDSGNTWLTSQLSGPTPLTHPDINFKAAAVNEGVFYVSGRNGLHRSTDSGKSWSQVNITMDKSKIEALIAYKRNDKKHDTPPTLYAKYEGRIAKTSDEGKSWDAVQIEIPMTDPDREKPPDITHIFKSDGVLYARGGGSFHRSKTHIYRVSTDGNMLVPIQGMPIFDSLVSYIKSDEILDNRFNISDKSVLEQMQEEIPGATQLLKQLTQTDQENRFKLFRVAQRSPFAVSGDTFYMEYNYKLFRWKPGDTEWHGTGVEETVELTLDIAGKAPKLAVSGDTVYFGKRDGRLVQSLDAGHNWKDIPLDFIFSTPIQAFKDIVFAGSTVYVATDVGVAASDAGKHWHAITDAVGTHLIMERLAVDGTKVYGVTKETGIYRLESGTWEQVVPKIPDNVISLAADGNTLYVGTQNRGMLHYNLEE